MKASVPLKKKVLLFVAFLAAGASLVAGCVMVPPPVTGYATVQYEGGPAIAPLPAVVEPPAVVPPPVVVARPVVVLPPPPPPPPIILPPVPYVAFNTRIGFEYVTGVNYDAFYVDGYFYTHHHDRWYCAPRPGAGWTLVEAGYVPRVLVPGPPVPGWRSAAFESGRAREIRQFREGLPFPASASNAATASRGIGQTRREEVHARNLERQAQQRADVEQRHDGIVAKQLEHRTEKTLAKVERDTGKGKADTVSRSIVPLSEQSSGKGKGRLGKVQSSVQLRAADDDPPDQGNSGNLGSGKAGGKGKGSQGKGSKKSKGKGKS